MKAVSIFSKTSESASEADVLARIRAEYRKVVPNETSRPALVPVLSSEASIAWDALARRAIALDPSFSPPKKPIGYFAPTRPESADIDLFHRLTEQHTLDVALQPSVAIPAPNIITVSDSGTAPQQAYLTQVSATLGWDRGGGAGIQVTVFDYSFYQDHTDFPPSTRLPLITGDTDLHHMQHGTRSLGVMAMQHNTQSGQGIVPNAEFRLATLYQSPSSAPISLRSRFVLAGNATPVANVLVVPLALDGSSLPLETFEGYSDVLRLIVAAGVIVVLAAGNSNRKLTSADFPVPETGTILVGAGKANLDRHPLSNYGHRVNCFAEGENVYTTTVFENNAGQFISEKAISFGDTSAATAIIGGVVCAIQGALYQARGNTALLTPSAMRASLQQGGIPCASQADIGVRPDLAQIFQNLNL